MVEEISGLGESLRRFRKSKGLTQGELSEKTGAPTSTISDLEKGRINNSRYLGQIAQALGVSIQYTKDNAITLSEGDVVVRGDFGDVLPVLSDADVARFVGGDGFQFDDADPLAPSLERMRSIYDEMAGFYLRVNTDAMAPQFTRNHEALVDTEIEWQSNDLVVALLAGDKNPVFRRIISEGGQTVLVADNKEWPIRSVQVEVVENFGDLVSDASSDIKKAFIVGIVTKGTFNPV